MSQFTYCSYVHIHNVAGYLNDDFHVQKAIFTFLGDDEGFAKQKDMTFTPDTNNTEYVLANNNNKLLQ